jgi:hypothetical protein
MTRSTRTRAIVITAVFWFLPGCRQGAETNVNAPNGTSETAAAESQGMTSEDLARGTNGSQEVKTRIGTRTLERSSTRSIN